MDTNLNNNIPKDPVYVNANTPLLQLNDLCKCYPGMGTYMSVFHMNLIIPRGRIIGLLGPNGCGKTTLIKMINGLLAPTSGNVLINGMSPCPATKKVISYLPERTYLDNDMKVSQMVEYFADFYEDFSTEKAYGMLGALGISSDARLKTLYKGTKEKVQLILVMSRQADLYILDEPSIGLHQRDNERLISSLKELRDIGNTVIVVEHDKDMMLASDYLIDIGPKAGRKGGEVVFQGTPAELLGLSNSSKSSKPSHPSTPSHLSHPSHNENSIDGSTAAYLTGRCNINIPAKRRTGNGNSLWIRGASGNNLKHVDVEFPLGKLIVVTGVSGSGKSTLVNETLQPILSQHFYRSIKKPMPYDSIDGLEHIDKVVNVDQSPLGRTPRSNPATYTGVFADIRSLFVNLPEAKIRGYKPGRFSFNVKGGRCETCGGNGYKTIEMNFLPDVMVPCEVCHGKRYNRETLEVRYKGKSIADVLDMTINQAVEFFENVPDILRKIKTIQDVGLGYIKLGQPSTTLSGGESQRVKLATELSKKDTGRTLYILDEPTTGLHFEDIRILMEVIGRLVDRGNTVVIIEHNLDVIKLADHIIDMGPEGGRGGGEVLSVGTPEEVAESTKGYTPRFLKAELENKGINNRN